MELKLFLVLCLGVTFGNEILKEKEEEFVEAATLGDLWKYVGITLRDSDDCYYKVQTEYEKEIDSFHKKAKEGMEAMQNHLWGDSNFKLSGQKAFEALYEMSKKMKNYKTLLENALGERNAKRVVQTILQFEDAISKDYYNYLHQKNKMTENHKALLFFNEYDEKVNTKSLHNFKEITSTVKRCLSKIKNPCIYK